MLYHLAQLTMAECTERLKYILTSSVSCEYIPFINWYRLLFLDPS